MKAETNLAKDKHLTLLMVHFFGWISCSYNLPDFLLQAEMQFMQI